MEPTTVNIKRVAFFGDAEISKSEETYKQAMATAKLLATKGYVIVNGGGPGIMMAATEGAKLVGGEVELVIIKSEKEPGNYMGSVEENLVQANRIYEVENIQDRTEKLIEVADAFVIFQGGTGTLAEMSLVWELAKFNYGHHEPVIFFGEKWAETIATIEKNMNFESKEKKVVTVVHSPEEVLKVLVEVEN